MAPLLSEGLYSQLYRQITGETSTDQKRAQQVAHKIEEEIIANNWATGHRIGAEADISERFQVGRCSAREAIRILQLRGSFRTQRGPGGGLAVAALARAEVLRSVCSFFAITGIEQSTVMNARRVLSAIAAKLAARTPDRHVRARAATCPPETLSTSIFRAQVVARSNNTTLLLLNDCIELLAVRVGLSDRDTPTARNLQRLVWNAIEHGESDTAARAMTLWRDAAQTSTAAKLSGVFFDLPLKRSAFDKSQTLAESISQKLAEEIRLRLREGDLIGSEVALQERYQTGRVVMRQAIRMIEESGLAFSVRGRGRGLVVSQPSSGPTNRLLCTYLAQQSILLHDVWIVMRELHVEQARLATHNVSEREREQLDQAVSGLPMWSGPFETLPVANAEMTIMRLSHNPILELFVQFMQAYCMYTSARNRGNLQFAQGSSLQEYRSYARAVLEAIKEGDSNAAAEAEWSKHEFLQRKVWPTRSARR